MYTNTFFIMKSTHALYSSACKTAIGQESVVDLRALFSLGMMDGRMGGWADGYSAVTRSVGLEVSEDINTESHHKTRCQRATNQYHLPFRVHPMSDPPASSPSNLCSLPSPLSPLPVLSLDPQSCVRLSPEGLAKRCA